MERIKLIFALSKSFSLLDLLGLLLHYISAFIRSLWHWRIRRTGAFYMGSGCEVLFPSKITLGKNVRIGSWCVISGFGDEGLEIGDNSSIGSFSRIIVSTTFKFPGRNIKLGSNVGIGEFASLAGSGGLQIGNDTIIGQYFSAHPENHKYSDINQKIRFQGTSRATIVIGEDCWIGSKVTVLAGVKIGSGCVVGAGSVVTGDIPPNSIAVGNPCKVIKVRS